MRWVRDLETGGAEAEGDGRLWVVRRREHGFSLFVDDAFVDGGYARIETAKREAGRLEASDDPPAEIAARREKTAHRDRRAWVKAAKRAKGPKKPLTPPG